MNKKFLTVLICLLLTTTTKGDIIQDEFVKDLVCEEKKEIKYNFEDTKKIKINIKIANPIKSEDELYEGQIVDFIIDNDIKSKGELYAKKGALLKTKVNTIISSGMNGIPASIIFSEFELDNLKKENFSNELEIFGQDRSLWVYPLKWALTFLPPTGSLTNFIKGGKVKIKTNKIYTIYYYPNWS